MSASTCAMRAHASTTPSTDAPGGSPSAMFWRIVSLKRNVSWETTAIRVRRTSSGIRRTSCPSSRTVPGGGS
jgi:hypothetical protein